MTTDSDTAARARQLLDAKGAGPWVHDADTMDVIADLLAERDAAVADAERNASMATEYAGKAVEYKQEKEAAEAERDDAVARADAAEELLDELPDHNHRDCCLNDLRAALDRGTDR